MRAISGKQLARVSNVTVGTFFVRTGHHVYGKPGSIVRLSVPIHGNTPLKMGLLKHLMKMASLTEDDLL